MVVEDIKSLIMSIIAATITLPGDPSVGLFSQYYKMELPDFREFKDDFPGNEYTTYMEQWRKQIHAIYSSMIDEHCIVTFSFEEIF